MEQIFRKFAIDSLARLSQFDCFIVGLVGLPRDGRRLGELCRDIQTIKERCGLMGLEELGSLANAAQNMIKPRLDDSSRLSPLDSAAMRQALGEIKRLLLQLRGDDGEDQGGERRRDAGRNAYTSTIFVRNRRRPGCRLQRRTASIARALSALGAGR